MAFPDGAVLVDDFNRASLGANWSNLFSGFGGLQIVSNQLKATDGDDLSYYNVTTFGPDVYAYVTLTTIGAGTNVYMYGRVASPGTSGIDAYEIGWNNVLDQAYVARVDNASFTTLATANSVTFAAGDLMGMGIVGSTITMYRFTGGSWSEVVSATDSTYGAAGYIGIEIDDTTTALDDFYAGTSGGTPATGFMTPMRGVW